MVNRPATKRKVIEAYKRIRATGRDPQSAWSEAVAENVREYTEWLRSVGVGESELNAMLRDAQRLSQLKAAKARSLAQLKGDN